MPFDSENDFRLTIFLTELGGIATFALAEETIEVAQRVEATAVAYLCHRVGGVHQSASSKAQSYINNILGQVLARAEFEKTAEGRWCHACKVGQLAQPEVVLVVVLYETLHLQHTP